MKNNPYIGPRPYGRGEGNFFGREREGKELAWLILAEQAVLFYAQSGAGKTSLLNARVIPILEQKGVQVLPVARVGSALPECIAPEQVDNIFVFSALLALSADANLPPETLLNHTLLSYLQTYAFSSQPSAFSPQLTTHNPHPSTSKSPTLLILDQFEEIATTHREHWAEAEGFFHQVREAIDALPGLGVLFVLREDYVAELDPYTPLLPSHLQARFRMTLPTRPQALQIVMGPAAQAGVPFAEEAAHNLVANLSRIKTSLLTSPPVGGTEGGIGQYVEPVQLQVVSQQLWESLPDSVSDDGVITWDEIKHYNVDDALTTFYETTLAKVFEPSQGSVTERRLRRWFSEALITPEGRRGLALQGATETAGLLNAVVTALENHHLIRAETRGGSRWYELSHDRLVEPIVQSNRGWEAAQDQAHPWRPIARQWKTVRSETLLYRGKELEEAQAWLEAAAPDEVEGYEREFIEASGEGERGRIRRQRRFTAIGIIGLLIILAMSALTWWATDNQKKAFASEQDALVQKATAQAASTLAVEQQATAVAERVRADEKAGEAQEAKVAAEAEKTKADQQAQIALSRLTSQLVSQSTSELNWGNYDLALLLAIEAGRVVYAENTHELLRKVLSHPGRTLFVLSGHTAPLRQAMWSPDESRILTISDDNTVRVWDAQTGKQQFVLDGYTNLLEAWWSPDSSRVMTIDEMAVQIWDAETGILQVTLEGHVDWITQAVWSPDRTRILTASYDQTIRVWDAATGASLSTLSGHTAEVLQAVWSPDGMRILTSSADGTSQIWGAYSGILLVVLVNDTWGWRGVDVMWSADGRHILTAGDSVQVWDANTGAELFRLVSSDESPSLQAMWNVDSSRILVIDNNKTQVRVFDAGEEIFTLKHSAMIYQAQWNKNERYILTASADKTARVWNAQTGDELFVLAERQSGVWRAIWTPDESRILTLAEDGTIRIWYSLTGMEVATLSGHTHRVTQANWNSDSSRILTASDDGTARVWLLETDTESDILGLQGEALLDIACQRALRNMTYREWHSYLGDIPYHKTCENLPIHSTVVAEKVLQSITLIRAGDTVSASLVYQQASQLAFEVDDAELHHTLCWSGAIYGQAQLALPHCERAVELAPNKGDFRDSRGLARALTRDYAGAIENFSEAVRIWKEKKACVEHLCEQRETWIAELKDGRNPLLVLTGTSGYPEFRLVWPTEHQDRITQAFGANPQVYQSFGLPGHEGIDFGIPVGSSVYAAADGIVNEIRLDGDSDIVRKPYGNQIRILHPGGYESIYAQLSQVIVMQGQVVKAGQPIALSGNTGQSTGPHLHFMLKLSGATERGETEYPKDVIDPTPYLTAAGETP
ncbi:MAG: peptidoglycan DD-metalloendopeptidase family protein [Anaerolineae bacterium]|nr:peptidoglycan DD-metalloendopeptidase family protein [Anaerolineae bacterium]